MSIKLTNEDIEKKFNSLFPYATYGYTLVEPEHRYSHYKDGHDSGNYDEKYIGNTTYIGVNCSKHGVYYPLINRLFNDHGCRNCGYEQTGLKNRTNLIGQKFNRLTPFNRYYINNGAYYDCKCDCGNVVYRIFGRNLTTSEVKSCGCLKKEASKKNPGGINSTTLARNPKLRNKERYLYLKYVDGITIKVGIGNKKRSFANCYKIICLYKGITNDCYQLEQKIKTLYNDFKKEPILKINGGKTECFTYEAERRIKCFINREAKNYNLEKVEL
jgi:hypothetical protein